MDVSLVILIALTALYAGAVTFLIVAGKESVRLAPAAAARVTAVVAAAFALMILLAHLAYPAALALAASFSFVAARRALAGDLGARNAAWAATASALLTAVAFLLVSYLAVMALIGALGVYQVLRLRVRTRPALLIMGVTLGGLLAVAAAVFAAALSTM